MEMPRRKVIDRLIAILGQVGLTKIRNGMLEGEDWDGLIAAAEQLKESNIIIDRTIRKSSIYAGLQNFKL